MNVDGSTAYQLQETVNDPEGLKDTEVTDNTADSVDTLEESSVNPATPVNGYSVQCRQDETEETFRDPDGVKDTKADNTAESSANQPIPDNQGSYYDVQQHPDDTEFKKQNTAGDAEDEKDIQGIDITNSLPKPDLPELQPTSNEKKKYTSCLEEQNFGKVVSDDVNRADKTIEHSMKLLEDEKKQLQQTLTIGNVHLQGGLDVKDVTEKLRKKIAQINLIQKSAYTKEIVIEEGVKDVHAIDSNNEPSALYQNTEDSALGIDTRPDQKLEKDNNDEGRNDAHAVRITVENDPCVNRVTEDKHARKDVEEVGSNEHPDRKEPERVNEDEGRKEVQEAGNTVENDSSIDQAKEDKQGRKEADEARNHEHPDQKEGIRTPLARWWYFCKTSLSTFMILCLGNQLREVMTNVKERAVSFLFPASNRFRWFFRCQPTVPELIERQYGICTGVKTFKKDGFVNVYSLEKRTGIAYEYLTKENCSGDAKRKKKFIGQPDLEFCPTPKDFKDKKNVYQKGHSAPSGNYQHNQSQRDDTNSIFNIVLQFTRRSVMWDKIEIYVRDLLLQETFERLLVINGGVMMENEPGRVTVEKQNDISIPTHLFKIVIAERKGEPVTLSVFIVPNKPGLESSFDVLSAFEKLEKIEKILGYRFMPKIDRSKLIDFSHHFVDNCLSDVDYKIFISKKKLENAKSLKEVNKIVASLENVQLNVSLDETIRAQKVKFSCIE